MVSLKSHFSYFLIFRETVSTEKKLVSNNEKTLFEVCGILEIVVAHNGIQGHDGCIFSIINCAV